MYGIKKAVGRERKRNSFKDEIHYKQLTLESPEGDAGEQGHGEALGFWNTSRHEVARDEEHRVLKGELANTKDKLDFFSLSFHMSYKNYFS